MPAPRGEMEQLRLSCHSLTPTNDESSDEFVKRIDGVCGVEFINASRNFVAPKSLLRLKEPYLDGDSAGNEAPRF